MKKTKIKSSIRKILISLMISFVFVGFAGAEDCTEYIQIAEKYGAAGDYGAAGEAYNNAGVCYHDKLVFIRAQILKINLISIRNRMQFAIFISS